MNIDFPLKDSLIYRRKAIIALAGSDVSYSDTLNGIIDWRSDPSKKPTEEQIQAKLTEFQAEYDAKKYQRDRAASYPDLAEQFDLLWHAIDGGKFNVKSKETDFYKKLKAVKDANPKPE